MTDGAKCAPNITPHTVMTDTAIVQQSSPTHIDDYWRKNAPVITPHKVMTKGTRTVQADSVSDADSESRHKERPLFISAGAYSPYR